MDESLDRADPVDRRAEAERESTDPGLFEPVDTGAAALHRLTRIAVPLLADWCVIDVPAADGRLRPAEIAHENVSRADLAQRLERDYLPDPRAEIGPYAVFSSGEPLLFSVLTGDTTALAGGDTRHARLLRKLGLGSAMIVPLRSSGAAVGVMTLAMAESGRRFTELDVGPAIDLAAQAAAAIEARAAAESARADAERANLAKTEFLAVMSHELRTPLNAIMGYADLLEGAVAGPLTDTQARHLQRIRSSANHLLALINQVLSLSRAEAGKEQVNVGPVDLTEIARDAANVVEPAAAEKGLALQFSLPDTRGPVHTDGGKLRQILINLLSNAIKFTDRGFVELIVQLEGDALACTVRDTGIGIAAADLERIFEPFVQVDSSSTRQRGGTGLGLPVSRRFARMLGGELAVTSQPGVGTTFRLLLPVQERPSIPLS